MKNEIHFYSLDRDITFMSLNVEILVYCWVFRIPFFVEIHNFCTLLIYVYFAFLVLKSIFAGQGFSVRFAPRGAKWTENPWLAKMTQIWYVWMSILWDPNTCLFQTSQLFQVFFYMFMQKKKKKNTDFTFFFLNLKLSFCSELFSVAK